MNTARRRGMSTHARYDPDAAAAGGNGRGGRAHPGGAGSVGSVPATAYLWRVGRADGMDAALGVYDDLRGAAPARAAVM